VTDGSRWPRLLTALAIDPSDWRSEAGRILRYGLVGGLTAVVYFTVTIAGVEWIGFAPVVASLVAQAATVGLAFYGHALYSFQLAPNREYFVRFVTITTFLFGLNFALSWLMTRRLGMSYPVAMVVVAVAIPLANFVLNRFWVFLPGLLAQLPARRQHE
jgi:putative flippase GtrA